MYKHFIFVIALLCSGLAQAEDLNYGDYSAAYMDCLNNVSLGMGTLDQQMEKCRVEECAELEIEIDKFVKALKVMPKFKEYNSMHNITLSESVQMRKKYGEAFCEAEMNLLEHNRDLNQCRLTMLNNLYVDLYNLYNAAKK